MFNIGQFAIWDGATSQEEQQEVRDMIHESADEARQNGSNLTWQDIKDFASNVYDGVSGFIDDVSDYIDEALNNDGSATETDGSSGDGLFNNKQQQVKDLIDATTKYNNEWSAQQAQIQRDFQERMARNAHLYEVQDLQNAGLNPVLSAGGNGAATPTGAMGQTDTSNTRLIGELAMTAIQGLSGAAAGSNSGSGLLGWLSKNRGAISAISNIARVAKWIFG